MESILADMMLLVQVIRESVHVGMGRHTLMESSVKHCHLRTLFSKELFRYLDSEDVPWIVQGGQHGGLSHRFQHILVDECRTSKALASMNHPMAD